MSQRMRAHDLSASDQLTVTKILKGQAYDEYYQTMQLTTKVAQNCGSM